MKKISQVAFLFIAFTAFVCMNSCEPNLPSEDTTKLWPAQTDTSALWGYINEKGKMVITPQYINAAYFSGGKACVILENRRYAFINRLGQTLYTLAEGERCSNFYYGYSTFLTTRKFLQVLALLVCTGFMACSIPISMWLFPKNTTDWEL